jgi:SAM-dependent methyltransferase
MLAASVLAILRPMSLAYRLLYGVGFTPWEQVAMLPTVTEDFSALLDREENGRRPPYGPALDLGCRSGIWAVRMAERGWQVTGVDNVPKALRRARRRAPQAGAEIRLVEGDVTNLRAADVGSGFPFLLDVGVFHDELTEGQRAPSGR